jgi:hypothetical protein
MLTAQSNGVVALWSTFPFLVQLRYFDCFSTQSVPSSPLFAGSSAIPWQLINVALVSDDHPLSSLLVLSTLSRGTNSVLRCHITEPDASLFGETVVDGSPALRFAILDLFFTSHLFQDATFAQRRQMAPHSSICAVWGHI